MEEFYREMNNWNGSSPEARAAHTNNTLSPRLRDEQGHPITMLCYSIVSDCTDLCIDAARTPGVGQVEPNLPEFLHNDVWSNNFHRRNPICGARMQLIIWDKRTNQILLAGHGWFEEDFKFPPWIRDPYDGKPRRIQATWRPVWWCKTCPLQLRPASKISQAPITPHLHNAHR
ncbi:hypothetical protein E4T42_02067 [Aureobasidium subglaciale]|nr:hypothetical protein E4T42_02067 [Aureobasidium subglaciale]